MKPGGYPLTDEGYAKLLDKIARSPHAEIPPGLKENILEYYADPSGPIATKKNSKTGGRVQNELALLQNLNTRAGLSKK